MKERNEGPVQHLREKPDNPEEHCTNIRNEESRHISFPASFEPYLVDSLIKVMTRLAFGNQSLHVVFHIDHHIVRFLFLLVEVLRVGVGSDFE